MGRVGTWGQRVRAGSGNIIGDTGQGWNVGQMVRVGSSRGEGDTWKGWDVRETGQSHWLRLGA